MEIEITVQQTITIPDEALLTLTARIREKWGKEDNDSVHEEDLLNEAASMGLVKLPENYKLTYDQEWTDGELIREFGLGKKKKKK